MRQARVIRHVAFEDLGLFAAPLTARGWDISYADAGIDDIAAAIADADLAVICGGPIGVYETVGSSRVDLQACKLEYSIVSPK